MGENSYKVVMSTQAVIITFAGANGGGTEGGKLSVRVRSAGKSAGVGAGGDRGERVPVEAKGEGGGGGSGDILG